MIVSPRNTYTNWSIAYKPLDGGFGGNQNYAFYSVTWNDNGISWYDKDSAQEQYNSSNYTYNYLVMF